MIPPDKVLSGLLLRSKHTDIQNILMRISDRELAICLLYMEQSETSILLSFLPDIKQKRIKQEQSFLDRLNIRYPQYRTVIDDVILRLQGNSSGGIRSYVRPRR
jgi:hypothetical protein